MKISVFVDAKHPRLLEGLDEWVNLGLLGHAQIRRISRDNLTCELPEWPVTQPPMRGAETSDRPATSESDRQPALPRLWQSFKDEVSVRWLLYLGVFLVLISSAVLAASRWESFPAALQYGVLWGYTVVFWGVGLGLRRLENLALTARTLSQIALFLVPMNFWAMDTFGLWQTPLGWLTIAIAAPTLSFLSFVQMRLDPQGEAGREISLLLPGTFLGLSLLHWFWDAPQIPFYAIHIAAIGTAIARLYLLSFRSNALPRALILYSLAVLLVRGIFIEGVPIEELSLAIAISGWVATFSPTRSLLSATDEEEIDIAARWGERVGIVLLLLGWLVAQIQPHPWQATIATALGIEFSWRWLRRDWQPGTLLILFLLGLYGNGLLWWWIPASIQSQLLSFGRTIFDLPSFATFALWSVALFPYLLLWLWFMDWLYQQEKPDLAGAGEQVALVLGLFLSLVGTLSEGTRSLNLILSAATLSTLSVRRQPPRSRLVYLAHATLLIALASTVSWFAPSLTGWTWGIFWLLLASLEWAIGGLCWQRVGDPNVRQLWYRSSWHAGFTLAGISYSLLFERTLGAELWGLLWAIAPLTLTVIAERTNPPRRNSAATWSAIALIVFPLLAVAHPGARVASFAIATGLMAVNVRLVPKPLFAAIDVGLALCLLTSPFWGELNHSSWVLFGATLTGILWGIFACLQPRRSTLAIRELDGSLTNRNHSQQPVSTPETVPQSELRRSDSALTLAIAYSQAVNAWALTLFLVTTAAIQIHCLWSYSALPYTTRLSVEAIAETSHWHYPLAIALAGGALIGHFRRQPTNGLVFGIGVVLELFLAESLRCFGGTVLALAIGNAILAVASSGVLAWQFPPHVELAIARAKWRQLASFTSLPLWYAIGAIALRLPYFTAYTGWLFFAASLAGLMAGRRYANVKWLSYFSLTGMSLAIYELVLYQMLQQSGGHAADGATVWMALSIAIAFAYRTFAGYWRSEAGETRTLLNLTAADFIGAAHVHWGVANLWLASGIMTLASPFAPEISLLKLPILALGAIASTSAYALWQSYRSRFPAIWIYAGVLQTLSLWLYARVVWVETLSAADGYLGLAASAIALGIYSLLPLQLEAQTPADRTRLQAWRNCAIALPLGVALLTAASATQASLIAAAGFYGWLGWREKRWRWSYLSLLFLDWALWREFLRWDLRDPLWFAALGGLSLLYVAQVDPYLRSPQQRQRRHALRLFGSVIICSTAYLEYSATGVLPGSIGIGFILLGILGRVRAFLFVGTATFGFVVFEQLVIFSRQYSFSKWLVGLTIGIAFIAIAALLERRRTQIVTVLKHWLALLQQWE